MRFRFEFLPKRKGSIRLKCFYGQGPNYTEFYIQLDLVHRIGEFQPKEEPLDQVFREILGRK